MKLIELFHKPTAIGSGTAIIYASGDLVVTKSGEPGQVMGPPDKDNGYLVKLKNGREVIIKGNEMTMAAGD